MITLKNKQEIIKLYIRGDSKRKIARELGFSRNTVSKYIRKFEESKRNDVRNLPVTEEILKPPTYKKRVGRKRVLTSEMMDIIR